MIKIVTHSGSFHADDIFAVATIMIHLGEKEEIQIIRTRDEDQIKDALFVVDVGGLYSPQEKRFDHHQEGVVGTHYNEVPFAAFGLVWKEYGVSICGGDESVARTIEDKLVIPIDAYDNGVEIYSRKFENITPYTISSFFSSFELPVNRDKKEQDALFEHLVIIARNTLIREIKRAKEKLEQAIIVKEAFEKAEDKRIIILESYRPWKDVLINHKEPLFVIYPETDNGNWTVRAINSSKHSFNIRAPFPLEWAGKRDEDLRRASGVEDAVFCHKGRFIAFAKSREGAYQLAKKSI